MARGVFREKAVFAVAAFAIGTAGAFAADLPVSGPQGPFIVRQPVEWTGLYFGANAGYGWGRYSSNITFTGLTVVNAADLTAAGVEQPRRSHDGRRTQEGAPPRIAFVSNPPDTTYDCNRDNAMLDMVAGLCATLAVRG